MLITDYNTYVGFADPSKNRSVLRDTMGRYRTNIFYEFNKTRHEDYPPLYTMREEEWNGLPSAYQIYMHSDSEYEAAIKLVGSWAHWQRLTKSPIFMKGPEDTHTWSGLESWREEKEIKEKAFALQQLRISAAQGNVQAQKLLYEGDKGVTKRGRPSKAEVRKVAEEQAELARQYKDDMKRIKLVANNE